MGNEWENKRENEWNMNGRMNGKMNGKYMAMVYVLSSNKIEMVIINELDGNDIFSLTYFSCNNFDGEGNVDCLRTTNPALGHFAASP